MEIVLAGRCLEFKIRKYVAKRDEREKRRNSDAYAISNSNTHT